MKKSFTLHDLPQEERPRERLEKFGPGALSSQELLALVLGSGIRGESVMVTAQKILSSFGSLEAVQEASLEDLREINGIGQAKAAQIKACIEIARRINNNEKVEITKGDKKMTLSPENVFRLVRSKIKNYTKEHFFVLSADSRNNFLGIDEISVGTVSENLVHARETFEAAIRRHAVKVIIAHNHPSGNPTPSEGDLVITERLVGAGKIMDMEMIDHVIVSKRNFYSFREHKLI